MSVILTRSNSRDDTSSLSEDGWIPNAKLVFKAASKTDDYHSNMNWELFKD